MLNKFQFKSKKFTFLAPSQAPLLKHKATIDKVFIIIIETRSDQVNRFECEFCLFGKVLLYPDGRKRQNDCLETSEW